MMKKKVLFVATTAKTHINTFHLPYIKYFKSIDWQVDVVTNGDADVPYADSQYAIPIKRSPMSISNIKACKELYSIIKEENYDLITCHTPMGGVLARIAAHFAKARCVMYTAHGFHFFKGAPIVNNVVYKVIEKTLAHWTDILITINEEDYQAACKFKLKKGGRLYKINGIGVDVAKMSNAKNRQETRQKLGIAEDEIVFCNIGEMIKRKNQATLIKAFASMNIDKTRLLICGDGVLRQEIENAIKQYKVEDKVTLLGFRKDIPDILNASDVFVFPSLQEGLPVAVMEAMAVGLPVICSDIRGCRDLIAGGGGVLVSPQNAEELSSAMVNMVSSKCLKTMGDTNKKTVQNCDIKKVFNSVVDILKVAKLID